MIVGGKGPDTDRVPRRDLRLVQLVDLRLDFGDFSLEPGDLLGIVGLIFRAGQKLAQFLHARLGGLELFLLLLVQRPFPRKLGVAMLRWGG
jgi:hypothetical protein